MYRITLAIGDRQCKVICYANLDSEQYNLLCENSEFAQSDNRVIPENGFDEGGDCCTSNCDDPCGLCLYHPLIMMIELVTDMSIEVNENIIHKILEWIIDSK
jgi:hypothetical protein